jgi:hypothetical protein
MGMSKGALGDQKKADAASLTASNAAGGAGANASNAWSSAFPELKTQAAAGTGYTPGQQQSINAANMQSSGGAAAGVTDRGNLAAGRTRNAGGFSGAIDEGARIGGDMAGRNAVASAADNAKMAQQKQQAAISTLGGLYGTNMSAQNAFLGTADKSLNTSIAAGQAAQADMTSDIKTAQSLAGPAGGGM